MLHAGGDMLSVGRVSSLVAADSCRRHDGSEVRIFAVAFSYTTPPWVTGDVYHRTESPVNSGFLCLHRSHRGPFLHQFRIKTACLSYRHGQNGPVTVDHVKTKDYRDAES